MDHPSSPVDSFIQSPPKLVGTTVSTSDVQSNHRPTPSPDFSSSTGQEVHLDAVKRWSGAERPKRSQDSETGASSLLILTVSQSEPGKMLSGVFDGPHRTESSKSTYSTASLSPSLRSQSGQPLRSSPSFSIRASPVAAEAEVYSERNTERGGPPHRHVMKVAGLETSLGSTSNTWLTSSSHVNPPSLDGGFTQSRVVRSFPGLPSSPAAPLALSHSISENIVPSQTPPHSHSPYTKSTFLDSPPQGKWRLESHGRGHYRSLSHSSSISRNIKQGNSQMETSDSTGSRNYASVAYAMEKARRSAQLQPRGMTPATSNARAPQSHARTKEKDHVVMERQGRKSEKELLSLLSSRPRSRPRSHSWSMTGEKAPERI